MSSSADTIISVYSIVLSSCSCPTPHSCASHSCIHCLAVFPLTLPISWLMLCSLTLYIRLLPCMLFNIFKSQLWNIVFIKFRGGTILHASNIWTLGAAPSLPVHSSIALCNIVLHTPFHSHTHGLWNPILTTHVVCVPCHVRGHPLTTPFKAMVSSLIHNPAFVGDQTGGAHLLLKKSRGCSWPPVALHPLILARYELLSLHDTTNLLSLHWCCLTRPHLAFASHLPSPFLFFLSCPFQFLFFLGFVVLLNAVWPNHILTHARQLFHRVFNVACHCRWVSRKKCLVHLVLGSYTLKGKTSQHFGAGFPLSLTPHCNWRFIVYLTSGHSNITLNFWTPIYKLPEIL